MARTFTPQFPVLFALASKGVRCPKRGRTTGSGVRLQCVRLGGHDGTHLMDIPASAAAPGDFYRKHAFVPGQIGTSWCDVTDEFGHLCGRLASHDLHQPRLR